MADHSSNDSDRRSGDDRRDHLRGGSSGPRRAGSSDSRPPRARSAQHGGSRDDRRPSGTEDRRGGYRDDRRSGGSDDRRGGYRDDRRGGYRDDRRQGSTGDRRDGSRDDRGRQDRRNGHREDRRPGGSDDRRGGYRDDRRRDGDRRGGPRDDRRGGHRDDRRGNSRDDRGRQERRDDRGSRPGQEARADRPVEPRVPEGITGRELDGDLRAELRGLSKETAERVGRHLVSATLLEDEDPETALAHARFAARLGGRVGGVREIYGTLAYRAGEYQTALRELRTALRITGRTDVLPMIADCERGMGRPERALDVASSPEADQLAVDATIELMIVVAGAYADTGDVQTALQTLEVPALRHKVDGRWQVRLWVAYADLLEKAGRGEEAHRWLTLAADADTEQVTDAAERLGRPSPVPAPQPAWEDDEEIAVLDAFDEDEDDEPRDAESSDDDLETGEHAAEDALLTEDAEAESAADDAPEPEAPADDYVQAASAEDEVAPAEAAVDGEPSTEEPVDAEDSARELDAEVAR